MLAAARGADQALLARRRDRAACGELIALPSTTLILRASPEVSKAIWNGEEHDPKTEAGHRNICISFRLAAHLASVPLLPQGRVLFPTAAGNPWDASNVLEHKLNTLLDRLSIPKIDQRCWKDSRERQNS